MCKCQKWSMSIFPCLCNHRTQVASKTQTSIDIVDVLIFSHIFYSLFRVAFHITNVKDSLSNISKKISSDSVAFRSVMLMWIYDIEHDHASVVWFQIVNTFSREMLLCIWNNFVHNFSNLKWIPHSDGWIYVLKWHNSCRKLSVICS